jgi:hypothetical protein
LTTVREAGRVARHAALVIACCRTEPGAPATELYPDPDSEALRAALVLLGHPTVLAAWDDPDVDWASTTLVVIRSTWDAVDHPDAYVGWAAHVAQCSVLVNPARVVAWNLDKAYLAELDAAGASVVPTSWVRPGDSWSPPPGDYVVKPSVSAGGRETAWYGPDDAEAAIRHVDRLTAIGATVMVQPYLPGVEHGELSVVFVGGQFSHAFRRGPLLTRGVGVMEHPWEHKTVIGPERPSPADLSTATAALSIIEERFADAVTYARVDLVAGHDGSPLVSEVELVDPYLGLTLDPTALERFAAAIAERAESK